jgi:hypothetical protein
MRRLRPRPAAPRPVLQLVCLEDRVTPTISFGQPYGGINISGSNGQSVAVGDYTGDGKPDIALGVFTLGVDLLVNDGSGQFSESGSVTMGTNHVKLVDMDGDGKLDLVSSHDFGNQLCFARGNGNGTFQTPIIRDVGEKIEGLVIADITGDGKPDVVATTTDSLLLVPNDGTTGVINGTITTYAHSDWEALGLATGDFNGDGKPDVAVAGRTTHAVHVFLNNGAGGLAPDVAYPTTGSHEVGGVSVGDVNHDGKPDLLAGYFDVPQEGIYLGTGNGTFGTPTTLDTPDRGPAALADFDGDGNPDLAAEGFPSSTLAVFAGNGTGGFASPTVYNDGINPSDVAIADINQDGQPDIVNSWASSPAGYSVRLNTSNNSSVASFAVAVPPTAVAGLGFSVTVTARDASGATLTGYTGRVHFTSTDPLVSAGNGLPSDYTFGSGENGQHTFTGVVLRSAGSRTITVTDTLATTALGSATLPVNPGAVAAVAAVSGGGQSATVGTAFGSQVVAKVTDAFGNPVAGATVTFAGPASGAGVTFPAGATATTNASGQAGVTVQANTSAGSYPVTATTAGAGAPASFGLTNTAGAPADIAALSGGGQSAPIGTTFGDPLVAVVTDAFGNPVAGATVTFAGPVSGAGATFPAGAITTTDASGQAGVTAKANAVLGSYTVTATTAGAGTPAPFDLTNSAGVPAAISAVSGAGQSATVTTGFAGRLVAKVVDAVGNPVAGVTVTFAGPVSGAGVTFPAGATATTDASGQAGVTVTANVKAGSFVVTATTAGVAGGSAFALTNTAGAPTGIAAVSGDGQSATVGTTFGNPLVVKVTDAFGNAVPGVDVLFTGPASGAGASFPAGPTATTDGAGQATLGVAANTAAGPYSVTATTAGVGGSAAFALTNTAGSAAHVDAVSGGGQSASVNTAFGVPLVVKVTDPFGNPVAGVTVTFAGPTSGAGVTFPTGPTAPTGPTGQASLTIKANRASGSYAVTATTAGVGTPATFALTNVPGPGTIAVLSGGSQSAAVGATFAGPLVVKVTDSFGNPVPGVTVTFAGPTTGAGVTFPSGTTATTTSGGQAGVTVSANATSGSYLVTASAVGVTGQASFNLVNAAGAPAAVTAESGAGQTTPVTTGFVSLLVARVTDALGNGVPGVTVTFAGPATGAGVSFPVGSTAVTDPSGRAGIAVVANTAAGSFAVTASIAGAGTPASFALTNTPGAAAAVAVASGAGQSAPAATAYAAPLVARVTDAFGNPVTGVGVTFVGPAAGAGATFPSGTSLTTDAAGRVGVIAVAGDSTGSYAVTAAAAGVATPATFALRNTATPATRATPLVVSGRADGTAVVIPPNGSGGYAATPAATLSPFPGFGGDVRAATGDFNGDGVSDTVLVTGPGTKTVMAVVSGKDGSTLVPPTDPFGDANFTFGGFVAAGDIDHDGRAEWVITPELRGGPRVIVFHLLADGTFDITSPGQPSLVANFFGIGDPGFRDGDRAALGDVNGDGILDVFSIAAFNGGPRTALYDGKDVLGARAAGRDPFKLTGDFFAAPSGTDEGRGGRSIAVGDVNGDGMADLIATGDNLLGTGNQVVVFSGADLIAGKFPGFGATPLANFAVGGQDPGALVSVAAVDADGDGRADLAVGSGAGQASLVKVYHGKDLSGSAEPASTSLDPFGTTTTGGVFVG